VTPAVSAVVSWPPPCLSRRREVKVTLVRREGGGGKNGSQRGGGRHRLRSHTRNRRNCRRRIRRCIIEVRDAVECIHLVCQRICSVFALSRGEAEEIVGGMENKEMLAVELALEFDVDDAMDGAALEDCAAVRLGTEEGDGSASWKMISIGRDDVPADFARAGWLTTAVDALMDFVAA
jgi:hypothetical protein